MRMKYAYFLLKENYEALENLKFENDPYRAGNTSYNRGKVTNWLAARSALTAVSSIPTMKETCLSILENEYFANENDSFAIPYETYQELNPKYKHFLTQIEAILNFFESVGFDTTEKGFDIKMPPTDSFDEFAKNIELLNKAINQCPYLLVNDETIKLKKTDIGSIWFEFTVLTTAGSILLMNLAKLVDKCVKIKSHYVTVKQQEEEYRKLKLKNDILENIKNAHAEVLKATIENCVEELKQEIPDINLGNEETVKLKYSLETISKLMEKGLEIYASVDAPQEIKDLFPTSDEMLSLPTPKKLIEESAE